MPLIDRITPPFAAEMRAERLRLIETLETLSDAEFASGTTLCAGWSPRDVLGHLIGIDYLVGTYLPYGLRVNAANQAQVARVRGMSRDRLREWALHWADHPSPGARMGALIFLGDLAIHHQDVLRGLGLKRDVPDAVATAIFREGLQLSLWMNRRVVRHRLVPTDGHPPFALPAARDGDVRGTREALGMWLAGRDSVASELEFA